MNSNYVHNKMLTKIKLHLEQDPQIIKNKRITSLFPARTTSRPYMSDPVEFWDINLHHDTNLVLTSDTDLHHGHGELLELLQVRLVGVWPVHGGGTLIALLLNTGNTEHSVSTD